jgi:hypothetical protein
VRSAKTLAPAAAPVAPEIRVPAPVQPEPQVKVRSQAERDLLLALRSVQ